MARELGAVTHEGTEELIWYRYDGHADYFLLSKLSVVKTTKKGVVLDYYGKRKFVLRDSHKKFAAPTVELAAESFVRRKERQIRILRARLETAEEDLRVFELPGKSVLATSDGVTFQCATKQTKSDC